MHKTSKILFIALLVIQSSFASQGFDLNTLDPEYKETLVEQLAEFFYPINTKYVNSLRRNYRLTYETKQNEGRESFYQAIIEDIARST